MILLVPTEDTFLESFFGPGIALHVKSFEGKNTTDDFRINLHSCFGGADPKFPDGDWEEGGRGGVIHCILWEKAEFL